MAATFQEYYMRTNEGDITSLLHQLYRALYINELASKLVPLTWVYSEKLSIISQFCKHGRNNLIQICVIYGGID